MKAPTICEDCEKVFSGGLQVVYMRSYAQVAGKKDEADY